MDWICSKNGSRKGSYKIFEGKREESRRRVRSRLRWMEDTEKDLLEMNVRRWRVKAVDRENGRR